VTKVHAPTLEEVRKYHQEHSESWQKVLRMLDSTLINARDKRLAPIYLTKSRIKQPESAYLKFKRKNRNNPALITDWIGFRVLCLFQQDIEPTFKLLIQLMLNRYEPVSAEGVFFKLKEINIFNWPTDKADKLVALLTSELDQSGISKTIQEKNDGLEVAATVQDSEHKPQTIAFSLKHENRGSGYQSVHFVVEAKLATSPAVSCEVQLRTLLQDVWGELEHALSYKKGKIHPHIRNSFQLLSKELEAKDILVSQLRDIRDEESAFAHYAHISSGPSKWFSYPAGFFEQILAEPGKTKLQDYEAWCNHRNKTGNPFDWKSKAEEKLSALTNELKTPHDENCIYFLDMERAFLKFCSGEMRDAEEDYRKIIASKLGSEQWFPFFRLGEVCLAQDKIEEALVAFDQCEDQMKASKNASPVVDRYAAKIGLAYAYWSLGKEFMLTVIDKMGEAKALVEECFKDPHSTLTDEEKKNLEHSLANNLCYYYLEHWIDTPASLPVQEIHTRKQRAAEQYEILESLLNRCPELATSNDYDTLAWYCYQCSLKASNEVDGEKYLEKAKHYISAGDHLANAAPSRLTSMSTQREHIQAIMSKSRTGSNKSS